MSTKIQYFLDNKLLRNFRFIVYAFIILLSAQRPEELKAEQSLMFERWKIYYVDFGFPAKGYGIHSDTGEALLAVTPDFVRGDIWILNGGDSYAPPEILELTRHHGGQLIGSMTSNYPHPIAPYELSGRYQSRNWHLPSTSIAPQMKYCIMDEMVLEVDNWAPRIIFYFVKPCQTD